MDSWIWLGVILIAAGYVYFLNTRGAVAGFTFILLVLAAFLGVASVRGSPFPDNLRSWVYLHWDTKILAIAVSAYALFVAALAIQQDYKKKKQPDQGIEKIIDRLDGILNKMDTTVEKHAVKTNSPIEKDIAKKTK